MLWLIWLTIVLGFVGLYLLVGETTKRIRIGIAAILNKLGDTTVNRWDL